LGLYFGKLNPGDGYGAAGSIILIMPSFKRKNKNFDFGRKNLH